MLGHPMMGSRRRDPFRAAVKLQIVPKVTDVTAIDYSPVRRSITLASGAALSTAVADPWGGTRPVLWPNGGYAACADSVDWDYASGPVTLEAWVWTAATPNPANVCMIAEQANGSGEAKAFSWFLWSGNLVFDTTVDGVTNLRTTRPHGLTSGWAHLAVTLSGTAATMLKNGAVIGGGSSATHTRPLYASAQELHIGGRAAGLHVFPGYVGGLRITKAIARPESAMMISSAPPTR